MRPKAAIAMTGCAGMILFILALSYGFGSPVHYSDDIHFSVIDESSGKPLEGAAVLAIWWLRFGPSGNPQALSLYVTDGVSDAAGKVRLRGMNPRLRPPLYYFQASDPQLLVYRPGYRSTLLDNREIHGFEWNGPGDPGSARRRCYWQDKVVALEPQQTLIEAGDDLSFAMSWAAGVKAYPPAFVDFWSVLAAGYQHLPPDARGSESNPQEWISGRWSKR